MKQGSYANYTGNALQKFIYNALIDNGYELVESHTFFDRSKNNKKIFTDELFICGGIYNTKIYCDFILFNLIDYLIIESKWQESGGSVDEKYPYLVENIKQKYPYKTIIILDGGGYKPGAEMWLRKQVNDKLIGVFNMMEFQKWCNKGNLKLISE